MKNIASVGIFAALVLVVSPSLAWGAGETTPTPKASTATDAAVSATANTTAAVTVADAQCTPVIQQCGCGTVPSKDGCVGGANKFMCACFDPHGVTGTCVAQNKCLAISAIGLTGKNILDSAMNALVGQLGNILQKLMSGSGGGDSGGSSTTCSPTQVTNDVTLASQYPCIYTYSGSSTGTDLTTSSTAAQDLLNALSGVGTTQTNNSGQTQTQTTPQNQTGQQTQQVQQTQTIAPTANATPYTSAGVEGDIVITQTGGTLIGNGVDSQNQTAVAGFYGADSSGSGQSVIAQLCVARPWASSVVSALLSPTFFDNLCAWKGYQVGQPKTTTVTTAVKTPSVKLSQQAATTTAPVVSEPYVAPKVQIWASPSSVTLGARTSIFWSATGVASCTETSPDGSFSQSSLSGNAATVPITADTVFTISCLTSTSTPVSSNVTVRVQ